MVFESPSITKGSKRTLLVKSTSPRNASKPHKILSGSTCPYASEGKVQSRFGCKNRVWNELIREISKCHNDDKLENLNNAMLTKTKPFL